MLELRNITKEYRTGSEVVHALRGVSLNFRRNEFVSILGHSGCGKTTLLNIMGGLDQYTEGDLIINGVSTKEYKDADWDNYRNNSIGFVFQSYNLIPHQTVLANVELALTLSGISADERRERAIKALSEVGLGDQLNKKPAQMSGGQMQRVAIARALINNPDILLADEPTGALDSDTSRQIMGLLKEIASDRLVIMVTHNPDLAQEYSTRIVSLSDGLVTNDTDPYDGKPEADDEASENEGAGRKRTRSMSMKTALQLSLNNLMTKKARTILTAFAGSIGIIGIALILSVSSGFQNYIDKIEEDTLSTYPLSIQTETADMASMVAAFGNLTDDEGELDEGKVEEQQIMAEMLASVGSNDLKSFKKYFEKHKAELGDAFNAIQYGYSITPQIYQTDMTYGVQQVSPGTIMSSYMNGMQSAMLSYSNSDIFYEMMDNSKLLQSQVDILAGEWPTKYDDLVLVLDSRDSMNDYMAYSLGLRDPDEFKGMVDEVMKGNEVENTNKKLEWTYDDLLKLEFSLVPASAKYRYNSGYDVWEDMTDDEAFLKDLVANGEKLHISCIVCPKEGSSGTSMVSGVGYLPSLTKHVIGEAKKSDIVKAQLADKEKDVFSGKTFEEIRNKTDQGLDFGDMISIDEEALKSALGGDIDPDEIKGFVENNAKDALGGIDPSLYSKPVETALKKQCDAMVKDILSKPDENGLITIDEKSVTAAMSRCKDKSAHMTIVNKMLGGFGEVIKGAAEEAGGTLMVPTAAAKDMLAQMEEGYLGNETIKTGILAYAEGLAIQETTKNVPKSMGKLAQDIGGTFRVDPEGIASAFSMSMDEDELTRLITSYMSGNEDSSYEANLRNLGYADIEQPSTMSYYLKDFESKEAFMDFIDRYNSKMEKDGHEEMVISYTDITGVMMKSVKTITNAVSYVLIAFVAISLVVSSIMIGVITYISVLERTKEIGILRAIGASKRDISRVFNSETIIVGFTAGLIGIGVSLLLLIPINAILHKLTGIASLTAVLPVAGAVILVIISVLLTYIAGLIPSGMAAKKDPVEALRSE